MEDRLDGHIDSEDVGKEPPKHHLLEEPQSGCNIIVMVEWKYNSSIILFSRQQPD